MANESGILTNQLKVAMNVCAKAGCGVHQHSRDTVLIDQVRGNNAAINNNYKVRLDQVPPYDGEGRVAHLRGLRFEAILELVASGVSDEVRMRDLYGVFDALYLKNASGHVYFNNLDGRMLIDEMFVRFGRHTQSPYSWMQYGTQSRTGQSLAGDYGTNDIILPGNAPAGSYYVHFSFNIDFVAPPQTGLSQLAGLIPLPYLTLQGRDALNVRVASVIPNVNGVTVGEILTPDRIGQVEMVSDINTPPPNAVPGYDIYGDIEYLPGVVIDREWFIDSFTVSETSGILDHRNMVTEHLSIRYLPEEDQTLAADHDGISLMVGSFPVMQALSKEQAFIRTLAHYAQNLHSGLATLNPALDLPLTDTPQGSKRVPLIVSLIPARGYEFAAAGPISFKYASRGNTATFTRYLQRIAACHNPDNAQMIAETIANKCGCGSNGTLYGTKANGDLCTKLNPTQPLVYIPKRFSKAASSNTGLNR